MHKITHPFTYSKHKHRAVFFSLFGILLTLFFLLTGCGGNDTNAPDSKQLLQQAQDAMKQVNSYHFNLTTEHPGKASGNDIQIQKAEGDTLAPDKIQATGTVYYLGGLFDGVNVIAIGEKQYFKAPPLFPTWGPTNTGIDPHKLADPQAGIGALIGNIQNPGTATSSSVDNHDCWNVSGKLSTEYIAGIIGGSKPTNPTVDTMVCIGKSDHYPYQLVISGVVIQNDIAQTTRTIKFSKFNESITIQAPI